MAASVVALALFGIYHEVGQFGFLQWDDVPYIRDNAPLRALAPENLWWMLTSTEVDYWRPLSFLSHALDFALFGDNAGAHHCSSVLLHGINCALVGWLA